jgi:phosphopantothenoylcysteine decarboxylase/phosphopantothenate--cysteine ligase
MSDATLSGKKILLGVTGSIAAYKVATLTRLLIREGASVRVIMTPAAARFISPLTLSTLSRHEVLVELMDEGNWNNHVALGLWADLMVIAPLTANTLAAMATGACDNLLLAVYLSARCPVLVAPAMDEDMWRHPATQRNLEQLRSDGVEWIPVGHGELASGLVGPGRMAEPEAILAVVQERLRKQGSLTGKKVLITAGPTWEPLDPVRFIGNRSSGKMGIALAKEALDRGATVVLVLGPTKVEVPEGDIQLIRVQTAEEMYAAVADLFPETDIAVFAAAVADYRPAERADRKIKRKAGELTLQLVPNPDIAALMGKQKTPRQLTIGFALETNDELTHAREKMEKKQLDMIVLNSLNDSGAGFEADTNKITILPAGNNPEEYQLKSKSDVATDIWDSIFRYFSDRLYT